MLKLLKFELLTWSKLPCSPQEEQEQSHAPGHLGIGMEGNCQEVPAKLDHDHNLTQQRGHDKTRVIANSSTLLSIKTREITFFLHTNL